MVFEVWNANQLTAAAHRQSPYEEKAADPQPKVPMAVQQPKVDEKYSFLQVCTIDKKIGEGGYGKVYQVQYLGQTACLKTAVGEYAKHSLAQEIKFLRELSGMGGAPMVLCTADDDHDAPSWFIMEYLEGDLLQDMVYDHHFSGPLPYLRIFVEMAFELQLVHDVTDIVHNDLKFNNVIITPDPDGQDFHAHIFDFGLATRVGEPGPDYHYPPELYGQESPSTAATDVYQLGLMMSKAVSFLSKTGCVHWPQPDFLSKFIDRMLNPEPDCRPKMSQVVTFLEDLVTGCDH